MDDFNYRITPWAITLVLHNWPIMLCSALVLWAAIRAYRRPAQPTLLLLYGFAALGLAFEYQKHGLDAVKDTVDYVFARGPNFRDAARLILLQYLPTIGYLLGIALLARSLAMSWRSRPARSDPAVGTSPLVPESPTEASTQRH